jgi:hypothetical protein
MSDEVSPVDFGSDPLAAAGPDASEASLREYAAALVRNGMNVDEANKHLAARKAAPLAAGASELAVQTKERLIGDSEFVAKYLRGDPDAVARLTALDLKITNGGGNLTDRDLAPTDYDLASVDYRLPSNAPADEVKEFKTEFGKLASNLKLAPEHANALVHAHRDAVEQTARMDEAEREGWGHNQTAILESALGADADKQIAAAEATLQKARGSRMDLRKIVASNGASVALQLIQQAQHLQAMTR